MRLTASDLRGELGITQLAVRKKILDGIAKLRGYDDYKALAAATIVDSEEDMQLLCEAERLGLAELQRFEEVLHSCTGAAS